MPPLPPKYTFPELFPSSVPPSLLSDPLSAPSSSSSLAKPVAPAGDASGTWTTYLSEDLYFPYSDYTTHMDLEGTIFPDLQPQ